MSISSGNLRLRSTNGAYESLADRYAVERSLSVWNGADVMAEAAFTSPKSAPAAAAEDDTFLVLRCNCGCEKTVGDHPLFADDIAVPPGVADEGIVTIPVGGSATGLIDFSGDTDKIRVTLEAGQTYMISLRGTGAEALTDSFLSVKAPGGANATVWTDDDGGNGLYSLITLTATRSGVYTITAGSFSNPDDPGLGEYTVNVLQQGTDSVGDSIETASTIGLGTTFGFRETGSGGEGGTLAGDRDFYKIRLQADQLYSFFVAAGADYNTDFTAVPAGEVDTVLRLYNKNGVLVASSDDINFPGDISSGISLLAERGGTYYLEVTGYAGQTGGYAINIGKQNLDDLDPLDSINWISADNVDFGTNQTAYVYFGSSNENFGQLGDDGNPMVTIDWNNLEKNSVMQALEQYEKILGVNYEITTDESQATFRLLKTESQEYGAYFFPQDPSFGADQGVGVFNVLSGGWTLAGQDSLNQGGYAFGVILHEFGHAHGLAHPHDNGGGSDVMLGVTGSTGSLGVYDLNQGVYTVMSYNDAWQKNPAGESPYTADTVGFGWSGTLSAFDIAVLQERYGVLNPNAAGNTIYRLDDANVDGTYYETIWDTGGRDRIVYSGENDAFIDLTAATLDYSPTGGGVVSFVEGIFGGFTIANGVTIERAVGGTGNDQLIGNDADNVLRGRSGTDSFYGGGGRDMLIGGGGKDSFYFDAVTDGDADYVKGFASGKDKIVVYAEKYGLEKGEIGTSISFGQEATGVDQRLVFDQTEGKLFYDADGSGAGAKVLIATFDAGVTLLASDIIVV